MSYVFAVIEILSLIAMNILFFMCLFRPKLIHEFNTMNDCDRYEFRARNRWILTLLIFAFIGIGIVYYGGFMKLLSWMPETYGGKNTDGDWRPYSHAIAGTLAAYWWFISISGVFWICSKRNEELIKDADRQNRLS